MATVELVNSHADGQYLHSAELENIVRAAGGYGVLTHTISATVTEGDADITLPAFNYVAPDGSGGHVFVTYAGATLTRAAADSSNPANDILVGDASGNVEIRASTPTAETGDVKDAPELPLADDEILIAKIRRPANQSELLSTDITPRGIDVSEQWPSKGSNIASASSLNLPESGTYFDVTGTTTITAIESRPAGVEILLQFDSSLTITYNATSMILFGGGDRTVNAGDMVRFISEGSGNWREVPMGASKKTAAAGNYFLIPAGPGLGTSVSSAASADTYGSWTEMSSSVGADIFILGITINQPSAVQYTQVDIGTGAAASEVSIGETYFIHTNQTTSSENEPGIPPSFFPFPIPVASGTRVAVRIADEEGVAYAARVNLICINQSDLAGF